MHARALQSIHRALRRSRWYRRTELQLDSLPPWALADCMAETTVENRSESSPSCKISGKKVGLRDPGLAVCAYIIAYRSASSSRIGACHTLAEMVGLTTISSQPCARASATMSGAHRAERDRGNERDTRCGQILEVALVEVPVEDLARVAHEHH